MATRRASTVVRIFSLPREQFLFQQTYQKSVSYLLIIKAYYFKCQWFFGYRFQHHHVRQLTNKEKHKLAVVLLFSFNCNIVVKTKVVLSRVCLVGDANKMSLSQKTSSHSYTIFCNRFQDYPCESAESSFKQSFISLICFEKFYLAKWKIVVDIM